MGVWILNVFKSSYVIPVGPGALAVSNVFRAILKLELKKIAVWEPAYTTKSL